MDEEISYCKNEEMKDEKMNEEKSYEKKYEKLMKIVKKRSMRIGRCCISPKYSLESCILESWISENFSECCVLENFFRKLYFPKNSLKL